MPQYLNIGLMEERKMEQWNGGIMEEWVKSKKEMIVSPIIPIFQYSWSG